MNEVTNKDLMRDISMVDNESHKLERAGSNPAPATNIEIISIVSDDFLPCPFCGCKKANLFNEDMGWGLFRTRLEAWWIQCKGEGCYALQQGSTKEKVIARWNKRMNVEGSIIG